MIHDLVAGKEVLPHIPRRFHRVAHLRVFNRLAHLLHHRVGIPGEPAVQAHRLELVVDVAHLLLKIVRVLADQLPDPLRLLPAQHVVLRVLHLIARRADRLDPLRLVPLVLKAVEIRPLRFVVAFGEQIPDRRAVLVVQRLLLAGEHCRRPEVRVHLLRLLRGRQRQGGEVIAVVGHEQRLRLSPLVPAQVPDVRLIFGVHHVVEDSAALHPFRHVLLDLAQVDQRGVVERTEQRQTEFRDAL